MGMNSHKMMAGAGSTGYFGVGAYPGRTDKHHDVGVMQGEMPDSARSCPVGSNQGSPDHGIGKGHADHFTRAGSA